MSVEDTIKLAKSNDENLAFKEADSLWFGIDGDGKKLLEERLENLCGLQDETSRCLDRKSLKYHSKITSLLEVNGKLLEEYRYYYRAWTYLLSADYLYRFDMAEIAIDCYFRALIFQGNFQATDGGKLLFETMTAILACYWKMEDYKTMEFILPDFDKKSEGLDKTYRLAYTLIKDYLKDSKPISLVDQDVKKVIERSFFAEAMKED